MLFYDSFTQLEILFNEILEYFISLFHKRVFLVRINVFFISISCIIKCNFSSVCFLFVRIMNYSRNYSFNRLKLVNSNSFSCILRFWRLESILILICHPIIYYKPCCLISLGITRYSCIIEFGCLWS